MTFPWLAQALFNHLWQSTLFAALATLLTLVLRQNHARVRYWIWLTASFKFLIPFSLLAALGSHVGSRTSASAPRLFVLVEEIGHSLVLPVTVPSSSPLPNLGLCLLAIWLLGLVAVVIDWGLKAHRLRAVVRAASRQDSGVEVAALRRLEKIAGRHSPLELRFCTRLLEPGVFGIFRPVLLLPVGISECLNEAQLDAILMHEMCHARHRDNFYAAVQMAVAALFWFHPLVWWMGSRLMEERERACDEEVLRLGNEPETYAESILRVCRFYLESPLLCVSGVTGANLKKRIECIMTRGIAHRLGFARKLLLATAAGAALIGPMAIGSIHGTGKGAEADRTNSTRMAFRSVSIQKAEPRGRRVTIQSFPDGRFTATNATLNVLIAFAYDVGKYQISGGPDWLSTERFNIDASAEHAPGPGEIRNMVRTLLADHFKLAIRREMKESPMLEMTIANNGLKLQPAKSYGQLEDHFFRVVPDHISARRATMTDFVQVLSNQTGRLIVDRTGLKGAFDVNLDWNGPELTAAMQEQLGLKLEPHKGPIEMLTIVSAGKGVAGT